MRARYVPRPRPSKDVPEGHTFCTRCKTVKPEDQFYATATSKWCKDCYRVWHRERYAPKSGATDEPRACEQCGKVYQPRQRRPSAYCSKECGQEARNAEMRGNRDKQLRKKYGISEAEYREMLERQNSRCAICEIDIAGGRGIFHVDHCHTTKAVRGLLCMQCNHGLGNFRDNPGFLRRAIAYLEATASD